MKSDLCFHAFNRLVKEFNIFVGGIFMDCRRGFVQLNQCGTGFYNGFELGIDDFGKTCGHRHAICIDISRLDSSCKCVGPGAGNLKGEFSACACIEKLINKSKPVRCGEWFYGFITFPLVVSA